MDLLVTVQRPSDAELRAGPVTDSRAALARVTEARERQQRRLAGTGAACNGEMDAGTIQSRVRLDGRAQAALGDAYLAGMLSARGRHRVVRVAQTIADLEARDTVTDGDVLLALNFRQRSGEGAMAA